MSPGNRHELSEKKRAALALALMNRQRALLSCVEVLLKNRKSLTDVTTGPAKIVSERSFQFFKWKCFHLLRNGLIETIVGVPQTTFSDVLRFSRHVEGRIPMEVRLCIFLKFIREGATQKGLHRETGISQSTISRIVKHFVEDFELVAHNFIKFPSTKQEIRTLENHFMERCDRNGNPRKIPCFCLLDGKHWRCNHPPNSGSLNSNYKSYFSFNSLAVGDADTRVMYLQISELGVNSDAQLYRNGPLPGLLQKAQDVAGLRILPDSSIAMPSFGLADNGFGLSKALMLPYRDAQLTMENMLFNEKLSATRVRVEHLFGQLSSRFHIFRRPLNLEPKTSRGLIVAAAVLHNMVKGPIQLLDEADDEEMIIDPYATAEDQRTALKQFIM